MILEDFDPRFNNLHDLELHYYVISDFENKTYCRPRIFNRFLLKDLFRNFYVTEEWNHI